MSAFHPKALHVDANQVTIEMDLPTDSGIVRAHPGDWIVRDEFGKRYVYTDTVFHQLYQKIGERSYVTSIAEEGRSYGC